MDRLSALRAAVEIVQPGGTISLSGVYGGTADPLNMLQIFDKQSRSRWDRPTSGAGSMTSSRCSPATATPLGVDTFAPTTSG